MIPLQVTSETAIQAISVVGFPIVAFLLMFQLTRTTIRENTSALVELRHEIARGRASNERIHRQQQLAGNLRRDRDVPREE